MNSTVKIIVAVVAVGGVGFLVYTIFKKEENTSRGNFSRTPFEVIQSVAERMQSGTLENGEAFIENYNTGAWSVRSSLRA